MSMFGNSKKPYTAISVQIDHLTKETYEENDVSGIPELIEVIRLQDAGPQEASRAIRKKLKYGDIHRQSRALTILDALLQNAGKRFQRTFADEPLLERLRIIGSDSLTDPDVKKKARVLFAQWAQDYKEVPGMGAIAGLYRQLPQKPRARPQPRPPSPEDETPTSSSPPPSNARRPSQGASHSRNNSGQLSMSGAAGPSSSPPPVHAPIQLGSTSGITSSMFKSSSKDKSKQKPKTPPFNLEKEKPVMIQNIASASVASTNLTNALKFINREKERVGDNVEVMKRFETCKLLRRQILRYIQFVESEQWLGGLIHANEELVDALTLYEALDKPIDQDSDSEGEGSAGATEAMGKMKLSTSPTERRSAPAPPTMGRQKMQPPQTLRDSSEDELEDVSEPEEEDDPDDPFGDRNAVPKTPGVEKSEPKW